LSIFIEQRKFFFSRRKGDLHVFITEKEEGQSLT